MGKTELFNYLNSFLKAQCVCSLLHCFPGRLQQDSDTSYALSHPDLSLAPFRLSFSLLRASERLSTDSFNSLPRSRTLIIPFTPSGPPRKHSTQRSLVKRSLLCSRRLHLFDQNTVKTVILWNIITI